MDRDHMANESSKGSTTMDASKTSVTASPIHQPFLSNVEVHELSSSLNGLVYPVYVYLPPSYRETNRSYPVLYALDADVFFGMQVQIPYVPIAMGEMPEFILVGQAYGSERFDEFLASRERDYTPTPDPAFPGSGGGGELLQFLQVDLVPFIESTYRANPEDRTLWGYSYGGIFALYVLFTLPELFTRYIATSPSVWWDGEVIFEIEAAYAAKRSDLPARLFTSLGTEESDVYFQQPWSRLIELLESRAYEGFELTASSLEGHTHFSTYAPSYVEGLRTFFGLSAEHAEAIMRL